MSLHDRAQKIITDLAVVSLWDNAAQEKAVNAIKTLALDCYNHGLKKTLEWESLPEGNTAQPASVLSPETSKAAEKPQS